MLAKRSTKEAAAPFWVDRQSSASPESQLVSLHLPHPPETRQPICPSIFNRPEARSAAVASLPGTTDLQFLPLTGNPFQQ